jgi:CheY-like chemotaxis protein
MTDPAPLILLVDDEPDTRANLSEILAAHGYLVHSVANGQEALDFLHHHDAAPSVILLDLVMPVLDGYGFRRRQQRDPALAAIPVIVLAATDPAEHDHQLGDVGYLQKPVDPVDLCATLERFTVARRPEILVVEDEPAIRRMLELVLRYYGFTVRLAAGGGEAIELFDRHRGTIDVVLLDVQMPTIDGPQTLTALRALDARVRAVFMTGNGGAYTTEDLRRRGAVDILQKPFKSMSELARLLGQAAQQ